MENNRDLLHGGPLRDGVYTEFLERIDQLKKENRRLKKKLKRQHSAAKEFVAKYGHTLSEEELEEIRIGAHNEIVLTREWLPDAKKKRKQR